MTFRLRCLNVKQSCDDFKLALSPVPRKHQYGHEGGNVSKCPRDYVPPLLRKTPGPKSSRGFWSKRTYKVTVSSLLFHDEDVATKNTLDGLDEGLADSLRGDGNEAGKCRVIGGGLFQDGGADGIDAQAPGQFGGRS